MSGKATASFWLRPFRLSYDMCKRCWVQRVEIKLAHSGSCFLALRQAAAVLA